MDAWTGPWIVRKKLKGGSYEVQHSDTNKVGKRHSAMMSPFPDELLPFLPVDGPDNVFVKTHTPFQTYTFWALHVTSETAFLLFC